MATSIILRVDEISEIFHDVTPLPQNDGPEPVCVISYPTSFVLAHDYMRACWKSGEKSLRSLQLSATCLKLNPANYTVWHYRRVCLDALGYFVQPNPSIIRDDLKLAAQLGGENPKNYQIWYHRRALLDAFHKIDEASLENEFLESELQYIAGVLENDSKNYHAWSHRQWLIRTIDQPTVWDQEMEYADRLIRKDPRNNSAWNQRWFAVHRGKQEPLSLDKCRQEADFALKGAELDPYNESPFRYLIGLFREQQSTNTSSLSAEYYSTVEGLRTKLDEAQRDPMSCVNWTSARIDLLEGIGTDSSLTQALSLATEMADQYDTIRKKYWMLRVHQLQEKKLAQSTNA